MTFSLAEEGEEKSILLLSSALLFFFSFFNSFLLCSVIVCTIFIFSSKLLIKFEEGEEKSQRENAPTLHVKEFNFVAQERKMLGFFSEFVVN